MKKSNKKFSAPFATSMLLTVCLGYLGIQASEQNQSPPQNQANTGFSPQNNLQAQEDDQSEFSFESSRPEPQQGWGFQGRTRGS